MNTKKILDAAKTLTAIEKLEFRIIDNSNQLYLTSDGIYTPTGLHFLKPEQVKLLQETFSEVSQALKKDCISIIKEELEEV